MVWYGRQTYYVAFDEAGHVTIYKGRPGGFLIFEPTIERITDLTVGDLKETAAERVQARPDQASRDDAEEFVANLCDSLTVDGALNHNECTVPDSTASTTSTTSGTSGGTGGTPTGSNTAPAPKPDGHTATPTTTK